MKIERLANVKLSVLVVDDEEDIRETLKTYLEMMDIFTSIVESPDGGDAFTKSQNQNFDLIVSDLMMPKVSGLALVENVTKRDALKSPKERTSIVLLSGSITNTELSRAVDLGVKNILTKPCSAQTFAEKIKEVLLREKPSKVKGLS